MTVFDDYLRTLRIFLPRDQRDDIIRELSEELRAQAAEQEAARGRPLTDEELLAIVGQYGHPVLTAARYRAPRHLIGPIVFPYYWIVLKVGVGLMLFGHIIGAVVQIGSGAPLTQLGPLAENAAANVLRLAALITALAAFADYQLSRSRALDTWRPSGDGHPQAHVKNVVERAFNGLPRGPYSRSTAPPSVAGFAVSVLVSIWWLAALQWPAVFMWPGSSALEWGPAMNQLYPVLVVAQLTMLGEEFVRLVRPEGAPILRVTRIVWLLTGWTLIYVVATANHQWVVPIAGSAGNQAALAALVNNILSGVFLFVALVSALTSLRALVRRLRRPATPAHA